MKKEAPTHLQTPPTKTCWDPCNIPAEPDVVVKIPDAGGVPQKEIIPSDAVPDEAPDADVEDEAPDAAPDAAEGEVPPESPEDGPPGPEMPDQMEEPDMPKAGLEWSGHW